MRVWCAVFGALLLGCPSSSSAGDGAPGVSVGGAVAPSVTTKPACDFTVDGCRARCDAGDQVSCYRLGRLLGGSYLGPPDDATATVLFRRACEAGVGDACNAVGVGVRTTGDLAGSLPHFERGCTMGSAKACRNGGDLRDRWQGVADLRRARALYERGCGLDQPATGGVCTELGQHLQRAGEREGALRALARACQRGEGRACTLHAALDPSSTLTRPSPESLLPQFTAFCDEGHEASCVTLAIAQRKRGDTASALRLLERACALSSTDACLDLAAAFVDGARGAPVDHARAARAATSACQLSIELNEPLARRGCRMLADRLAAGEGVPRDEAAAAALYVQTCEARPPFGCDEGARFLWEGRGLARDEARAIRLLKAGCARDDKGSCAMLKERGVDGAGPTGADALRDDLHFCEERGVAAHCANVAGRLASGPAPDLARAKGYADRACKAGHARGCAIVVSLAERLGLPAAEVKAARAAACRAGEASLCK